ncbi:MAG: DUF3078 domain-containing protein [Bacteroidota bacterium]|nr:DUF3078 domain-containing protein [Bacteroidota bacterium]
MKTTVTLITLILVFAAPRAQAQEKADGPVDGWNNTLVTGLNLTQVTLHNWTQGGENTLAWTFLVNGKFLYHQPDWKWNNTLKIAYGKTKLGDDDFQKSEDELFWESVYSRNIGWKIDPYVANQLRTQFDDGYTVTEDEDGQEVRTLSSGPFDPLYLIQSAGFTYTQGEAFFTRLGIAFKETFSSADFGFADDPDTDGEIEDFRFQTGVESATGVKVTVMENIIYTSQLNLFSAFNQMDVWDVRWDNTINAKVNDFVTASLNVMVVHEIAQTRRTQVKQAISLGLRYSLL